MTSNRTGALALALAALQGCGGESASHHPGLVAGTGRGGSAGAAAGAASDATGGSSGAAAGAGSDATGGSGGTSSMPPPVEICASLEATGVRHFEGFVLAVDRSAGMADSWDAVSQELLDLFSVPGTSDAAIGLRFFPDSRPVAGCDGTECDRDSCAKLLVPVAPLTDDPPPIDRQEDDLAVAVTENTITHDAPSPGEALAGALAAAAAQTTTVQPTSVVLITAGEADSCGVDSARFAAEALETSGTQTFVVAPASVGDTSALDAIAYAGGTNRAIRIGPPDGEALTAALLPIRDVAYSCSFPFPADVLANVELKFEAAVMQVTLDSNAPMVVPNVAGQDECGKDLGWYYDDPDAPTAVELCPALCDEVTQNRDSDLIVSFPCKPPRP